MADGWRLAPKAEADLEDIYAFGAERWSEDQAGTYARDLARLFTLLAAHPRMARRRSALLAVEDEVGTRGHPYRADLVFYREEGDGIEVLRIAHARSDWLSALAS